MQTQGMISPGRGFALALLLACAIHVPRLSGAEPGAEPPAATTSAPKEKLVELSEVIVTGEKPATKIADMIPWMRRLLGRYLYEGYVEVGGEGGPENRRPVRGWGTCIGFGVAPGVQCEMHVSWPAVKGPNGEEVLGGTSSFAPAMILYGLEPDELGIRYLQVDSRGLAEGATGDIIGDTATFKTPCVDAPEGCQRVVRITAKSESRFVEMQIDTEVNYELAMRYRFQLRRAGQVQTPVLPGVPVQAPGAPGTR